MTTETADPQATGTVIRELTEQLAEGFPAAEFETGDGRRFLVHRQDYQLKDVTLPNSADVLPPKVATTAVAIDTAASLIEYVNRFKNPNTVLFASEQDNKVVAVITEGVGGLTTIYGRRQA